jgi:hypothetical protein
MQAGTGIAHHRRRIGMDREALQVAPNAHGKPRTACARIVSHEIDQRRDKSVGAWFFV